MNAPFARRHSSAKGSYCNTLGLGPFKETTCGPDPARVAELSLGTFTGGLVATGLLGLVAMAIHKSMERIDVGAMVEEELLGV